MANEFYLAFYQFGNLVYRTADAIIDMKIDHRQKCGYDKVYHYLQNAVGCLVPIADGYRDGKDTLPLFRQFVETAEVPVGAEHFSIFVNYCCDELEREYDRIVYQNSGNCIHRHTIIVNAYGGESPELEKVCEVCHTKLDDVLAPDVFYASTENDNADTMEF